MSQVKREEMTILRPASEAAATAASAEDDIQLQTVAYQINEASNTGLCRVIIQQPLRPTVKDKLIAQGYTIKYVNNNAYNMEHHALIIWDNVKPGDSIAEPSLNGPKHSNHPELQEPLEYVSDGAENADELDEAVESSEEPEASDESIDEVESLEELNNESDEEN